mmetsp:Transcript_4651/g.8812  ORF Transcript_4651/g.8812 Transcript_4651/m.8812 type:complete len:206 (-) Transcript_4651:990-1607(-)
MLVLAKDAVLHSTLSSSSSIHSLRNSLKNWGCCWYRGTTRSPKTSAKSPRTPTAERVMSSSRFSSSYTWPRNVYISGVYGKSAATIASSPFDPCRIPAHASSSPLSSALRSSVAIMLRYSAPCDSCINLCINGITWAMKGPKPLPTASAKSPKAENAAGFARWWRFGLSSASSRRRTSTSTHGSMWLSSDVHKSPTTPTVMVKDE